MAAVSICSDFGAQKNKVSHRFHCFPVYQEMTRVNINTLGISELRWTGMGEFNSDLTQMFMQMCFKRRFLNWCIRGQRLQSQFFLCSFNNRTPTLAHDCAEKRLNVSASLAIRYGHVITISQWGMSKNGVCSFWSLPACFLLRLAEIRIGCCRWQMLPGTQRWKVCVESWDGRSAAVPFDHLPQQTQQDVSMKPWALCVLFFRICMKIITYLSVKNLNSDSCTI